jgi:hypothetical protein
MPDPTPCPGPFSRRHFLRLGALSLGVGALQPLRLCGSDGKTAGPDTSVILIWLPGGPPHMETYDMKPDAPAEYRGAFRPIRTTVAGLDVCEYLPMHARVAKQYSIIRSIAHTFSDHGGGHKKFLTGRDPFQPVGFVNDHPMVGSMVAKVRQGRQARAAVPDYVAGTDPGRDGIDVFSFGSAYLGPSTHPFTVAGDPSAATFSVKNLGLPAAQRDRLRQRTNLLKKFDAGVPGAAGAARAIDTFRREAMRLLTTEEARIAFDLRREPAKLRERYGLHAWGQRCLLARRLVEAGASFVTMVLENPYQSGLPWLKDGTYNWDSHAVNCHIFNDTRARLPIYDRAVTALVEDIHARGLDRKVLLIVTGEFGRTPRISYADGRPGRDHWPQAMSVLVSGGGLEMGQVIGSTNARGEHPRDTALTPCDLWATMFRHWASTTNRPPSPTTRAGPCPSCPRASRSPDWRDPRKNKPEAPARER